MTNSPAASRSSRWPSFWNDSRPLRRRAWWSRVCCRRRAFCLWAGSRRSANRCWSPTSRFRWRPARTGWAFRFPPRAACSFASSSCPIPQFVSRLATMRRIMGSAADQNLFIDTRATGHLLSAPQGLQHFLTAAQAAAAEIIILDPLYSTHDQDENDTRAMAALCQSLLRLRDASRAALIVVHHVRKSIGRYEIGSAFRGSSALHAVGDSYLLLTRPSPQFNTVELRFPVSLRGPAAATPAPTRFLRCGSLLPVCRRRPLPRAPQGGIGRRPAGVDGSGRQARYNQLRQQIMTLTDCSKRTAQMAITAACQQGSIVQTDGHYSLPG